MTGAIQQQLAAFMEGFYDIIPKQLISIFNEQELELLISGLPTIDIEDLKSNTEYHKYQQNSLQVGFKSQNASNKNRSNIIQENSPHLIFKWLLCKSNIWFVHIHTFQTIERWYPYKKSRYILAY